MAEHSKFQGTVRVNVQENVTVENLQQIITHIGGLVGCRTCGLIGIDLRLTGDPVESTSLAKLPGVKSVSFGQ